MDESKKSSFIYPLLILLLLVLIAIVVFQQRNPTVKDDLVQDLYQGRFIEIETNKAFQDVVDDVVFAISERNFRITNQLRIGNAIRERGEQDFPDNEVILFCNIQLAQDMLELDKRYLNYCPGRITVRDEGGKVIIAAAMMPLSSSNSKKLNAIVEKNNKLVNETIEFAAQEWQEVYD